MEVKDVVNCSFQNWYNRFRKVSPRSIMLPLPKGFVQYLLADGIILPEGKACARQGRDNESVSSDDEVSVFLVGLLNNCFQENWDTCDTALPEAPKFEEFDQKIQDSIKELGGKVFPKLNWSSPRDATWIALNNSCCCTSVADVYLLLKSSDFIMHDISQPFLMCLDYDPHVGEASCPGYQTMPYYLILRQWVEINPDSEFRCFVKSDSLIGITQRDLTMYSEYNVYHRHEIIRNICSFFTEHIQYRFPSPNYVFDVVLKRDVMLLDFNPFGEVTDSLLFDWSELFSEKFSGEKNRLPDYRCVTHNRGIQPRSLGHYAFPRDVVDISSGEDAYKLIDLLNLKLDEQKQNSSDDDDE